MSILVILVVREGLLFGADRNVTTETAQGRESQAQRRKVLKWPNREIVVGYVGRQKVDRQHTDDWLRGFISRNPNTELPQLARDLKSELQTALGGRVDPDDAMVVHLGGFVEDAGQWKPQVWYIRNSEIDSNYEDVWPQFKVSEEINSRGKFPGWTGNQIRAKVDQMAREWNPFWFRQGFDLATFHMLDATIRQGMHAIVEGHPHRRHPFPDSLEEWTKHLKMTILTYGAYFMAFRRPDQQYVGGGFEVVWAAWP